MGTQHHIFHIYPTISCLICCILVFSGSDNNFLSICPFSMQNYIYSYFLWAAELNYILYAHYSSHLLCHNHFYRAIDINNFVYAQFFTFATLKASKNSNFPHKFYIIRWKPLYYLTSSIFNLFFFCTLYQNVYHCFTVPFLMH